ncbi:MAG: VCBS repeat-containing protein [Myxococcales bacterium]|nr:VCBS repeat-containing protein [Myxococcales bacterium]
MSKNSMVWGLAAVLAACGDSGGATDSAAGSESNSGSSSTGGATPTSSASGMTGDASDSDEDDGTASMSASGTTTTTEPTSEPGTLSQTGETSATSTGGPGETGATSTGETGPGSGSDSTTGAADFCSPPEVAVEDVPLNDACDVELQMGTFTPVTEWKYGSSSFYGPPVAGQTIDTNMSGQLDAQDKPLVFIYENGGVTALWGDGSGVAWQKAGAYGNFGGLGLGDLEGDGWNEIVTASNVSVCALDGRDGAQKWCSNLPAANVDSFGFNYPALGDMDGDGLVEVVIGSAIFDSAGQLIGAGAQGKGSANQAYGALSVIVDLDADGVMEVVTGNAAYDLDGNTLWQNGTVDGMVAVADFDLDGKGEIVKTLGSLVAGLESDGTPAWGPLQYAGNIGTPAIDDLDGDGTPEIVFGSQNELIAMEWGGMEVWTATISDLSGAAGPALFDFESDGYPEVLYADEIAIRFFSGLDGSPKYTSMEHGSGTALETPIVADVDGDGHVEIVLGHGNGNAQIGAVTTFGDADNSWPPGRKIWNQHSYNITNVIDLV